MRQVVLMQGVSGAGKSTLARKLVRTVSSRGAYAQIVSADDFFCDSSGAYNFDPAKLGEAHDACFRKFLKFLMYERTELIVVDNTNTQAVQIAPYVLAATALGFRAKILHLLVDVKVAAGRNAGRAAPDVVEQQGRNLMSERLPAYWSIQKVKSEDVATDDESKIQSLLRWPRKIRG